MTAHTRELHPVRDPQKEGFFARVNIYLGLADDTYYEQPVEKQAYVRHFDTEGRLLGETTLREAIRATTK